MTTSRKLIFAGGIILLTIACFPTARIETMMTRKTIKLPEPRHESEVSVERALSERRSTRSYSDEPLRLNDISQLLWAAQGVTDPRGLRTAPSGGALYPLEVYVVVGKATDLSPGVYKYRPREHELAHTLDEDIRSELCRAAYSQSPVKHAPVVMVFCAVYERITRKYGERGMRYVHMEVGHAAQNVCLQAVTSDLRTVVIGAFDDNDVTRVMKLEADERPLYILPIGRPAR